MIGEGGKLCPFCDEETAAKAVFSTPEAYVLVPLNPVTEGHLLVIPRAHFVAYSEEGLHRGTTLALETFKFYVRAVGLELEHYNLIINSGEYASQSVEHMHWHFVPRIPGDGLMLPWTNQIKE